MSKMTALNSKPASAVYQEILTMLTQIGMPEDTRWRSLILYFREMKDYPHFTDAQKIKIQNLLTEILGKRDYSEERLQEVLLEYQNVAVDSYRKKIEDLSREISHVINNFQQLLSARYGNIQNLEKLVVATVEEGTTSPQSLVDKLHAAFDDVKTFLENDIRSLEHLAHRDALTNISNRRAFDDFMIKVTDLWQKEKRPVVLAMFDVDHFKRFNDTHGHRIGDQVLQLVAKQLNFHIQPLKDAGNLAMAARYGGEEFALVVSGPYAPRMFELVEEIRQAIGQFNFVLRDAAGNVVESGIHITVSAGIAECSPSWKGCFVENLIDNADKALYCAKEKGRNRSMACDPTDPTNFREVPSK